VLSAEAPLNGTFNGLSEVTQHEHDGQWRIVFDATDSVDPLIKALAAHTRPGDRTRTVAVA